MSAVSTPIFLIRKNIIPDGIKNGVNLTFEIPEKADPESIEVFLSGISLDPIMDFIIGIDLKTITIVVEPADPTRLNCPPLQYESLKLNYIAC